MKVLLNSIFSVTATNHAARRTVRMRPKRVPAVTMMEAAAMTKRLHLLTNQVMLSSTNGEISPRILLFLPFSTTLSRASLPSPGECQMNLYPWWASVSTPLSKSSQPLWSTGNFSTRFKISMLRLQIKNSLTRKLKRYRRRNWPSELLDHSLCSLPSALSLEPASVSTPKEAPTPLFPEWLSLQPLWVSCTSFITTK